MDKFEELHKESGYCHHKTNFLTNGFRRGFDLRYNGPKQRKSRSQNIPFSVGNKEIMWEKIMKEVNLKRFAGPFEEIPYEYHIQLPIGLVPKADNKTRLIFHLSFDIGEDEKSVNHHMPTELCSVKYNNLDQAVRELLRL